MVGKKRRIRIPNFPVDPAVHFDCAPPRDVCGQYFLADIGDGKAAPKAKHQIVYCDNGFLSISAIAACSNTVTGSRKCGCMYGSIDGVVMSSSTIHAGSGKLVFLLIYGCGTVLIHYKALLVATTFITLIKVF